MRKYTSGRGYVVAATIALTALIFYGLATETISMKDDTAAPHVNGGAPLSAAQVQAAISVSAIAASDRLDAQIAVLSPSDAAAYRTVFTAQKRGDWEMANAALARISDSRLLGHILADRYQKRGDATYAELAEWMARYADLPQSKQIYEMALRADDKAVKGSGKKIPLASPASAKQWDSGFTSDGAADFTGGSGLRESGKPLAVEIDAALRRSNPEKARDILIQAEKNHHLVGTFAADAKAAIAAGFFYSGEREQSRALAEAAATAKNPLGLWINGLLSWEQGNYEAAARSFTDLAEHPADLSKNNRAAARFWAWRAISRLDGKEMAEAAEKHLAAAAEGHDSFYGLLAAQLLDKAPAVDIAVPDAARLAAAWTPKKRDILASEPAGWRALALIQSGETVLAENELRRLSPNKRAGLRKSMEALADLVPMPALAMRLAGLSGRNPAYASAKYPLPPWQPRQGFQVDRALLYALARHESHFDPSAISSRGACGLMQIMPRTAGLSEGDAAGTDASRNKLFDPEYNISVGQRYVRHLAGLPQVGDNLIMLLVAYNGGPNSLSRLLKKNGMAAVASGDPLLFMESIPTRETRNYVARVLPNYWVYSARLNRPSRSLRQMAEGQWPRFDLRDEHSKAEFASVPENGLKIASAR